METIRVKDKLFERLIPARKIAERVTSLAAEINRDYAGLEPIFIPVLNGSFIFAADLLRQIDLPCQVSFVKLASYEGMSSTGNVIDAIGLNMDIAGRHVIIVEDIVDTGNTMAHTIEALNRCNPASLSICTLLTKPDRLLADVEVQYCAFSIPNEFIVGYGLDYDGFGRNLNDIFIVAD